MKKRFLSLLLLLALCLIIPAFADGDGASDTLTVDGITTPLDTAASGAGWSYDGAMTLTLSDYHGKGIFFAPSRQAHRQLSVVLQGSNSATDIYAAKVDEAGEKMFSEVHFCGTGSLELSSNPGFGGMDALYAMEGCKVTANVRTLERTTFRVEAGAELYLSDTNSNGSLSNNNFEIIGGTVVFTNERSTTWGFGVLGECTCEIYEGGVLKVVCLEGKNALFVMGKSDLFSKFTVTDEAGTPGVLLEPNSVGNGYVGQEGSDSSFGTVCITGSGKAPEQPAPGPALPEQPVVEPAQPSALTATPTASTVLVNGVPTAFDAYNIGGANYFKLRDLAFVLNGTEKQFGVDWDAAANAISLTSGAPYVPVGGEMTPGTGAVQTPVPTRSKILRNGWEVSFEAYNIGGNNYFKLRDLGGAFDFGVDWDGANNTVVIDTSKGYTPD